MQITTGTVIDGKIVVEGVPLAEGATVAILTRGSGETFTLAESQENELLAAMAEIDRGEYLTFQEVMDSLPRRP